MNIIRKTALFITAAAALGASSGCSDSYWKLQAAPPGSSPTHGANVYTPKPTYTPNPTYTAVPTPVPPTPTAYPTSTAYPTATPYPRATPTQTCDVRMMTPTNGLTWQNCWDQLQTQTP